MFSKACEYGIKAAIYIAIKSRDGKKVNVRQIAQAIGVPEAFTAKVLQRLSKSKILNSTKGPKGGFSIGIEESEKIMLMDIVQAIDGNGIITECILGLKKCSSKTPCPLHFQLENVRTEIKKVLKETSLHELSQGVLDDKTYLMIPGLKAIHV